MKINFVLIMPTLAEFAYNNKFRIENSLQFNAKEKNFQRVQSANFPHS